MAEQSTGTAADIPQAAARPVPLVETVSVAEELIEWLRPNEPRWAPYPGHWIFRGQRDSTWPLLPAAFRPASWRAFTLPGQLMPLDATSTTLREFNLLEAFLERLDRSGIDIPNGIFLPPHFRDGPVGLLRFPLEPAVVTFLALAQHHGIPTRLLDWTRVGLNAAYFAAAAAAQHRRKPEHQPEYLSVWALHGEFGGWCEEHTSVNTRMLSVVMAPRASNPNLHAQSGLFTETSEVAPIEQTVRDLVVTLESAGHLFDSADPLVRFDLPCSESPKLLRLLANEQIDGARMFPGRDGAVMALKEQCLWDR